MTDREVTLVRASDVPMKSRFRDWQDTLWVFDPKVLTLSLDLDSEVSPDGHRISYEIDLERCTTSAEVLDWICQVSTKTWADDTIVGGLVKALNGLLDPQSNLCSSGRHKTLTHASLVALLQG